MGTVTNDSDDEGGNDRVTLRVDDRGRITIPKRVRDRLGLEPNESVSARLTGSVLEIDPRPSSRLETATADRDDWTGSTPTDAGEALFGPMEETVGDDE